MDPYQARLFGGTDMEPNRAIVHQKLSADVTHADTDEGLVPFLRDINKQCASRSDAAICGI